MIESDAEVYLEPPILGYLKAGAPSNGEGIGKNQFFWRFQPEERHKDAAEVFRRAYGDRPTQINIWLCGHEIVENYDEWFFEFGKRVKKQVGKPDSARGFLKKKCTGVRIVRWLNEQQKKGERPYSNEPIPCQKPACHCERVGVFRFYIAELFVAGHMIPVEFSTKSPNHRAMFERVLKNQQEIMRGFGKSLFAVRMLLEKVEETISVPQFEGRGKDAKLLPGVRDFREEWMIGLRPDPAWTADLMRKMSGGNSSPLLVLPGDMQYADQTHLMLTPAIVSEMNHPDVQNAQAIDVEVVETQQEFKEPSETDRANINRLGKLARSLWNDKATWEQHLRTVLAVCYPQRHTSQLREHHCDRVVNELLVLWGAQQKDHEGVEVFGGQDDARQFFQQSNIPNGSDAAKRDKWVALVEQFKQPAPIKT